MSFVNSLPYIKCVLRLSCVVHGPIYGLFMREKTHTIQPIEWPKIGPWTTQERRNAHFM